MDGEDYKINISKSSNHLCPRCRKVSSDRDDALCKRCHEVVAELSNKTAVVN